MADCFCGRGPVPHAVYTVRMPDGRRYEWDSVWLIRGALQAGAIVDATVWHISSKEFHSGIVESYGEMHNA